MKRLLAALGQFLLIVAGCAIAVVGYDRLKPAPPPNPLCFDVPVTPDLLAGGEYRVWLDALDTSPDARSEVVLKADGTFHVFRYERPEGGRLGFTGAEYGRWALKGELLTLHFAQTPVKSVIIIVATGLARDGRYIFSGASPGMRRLSVWIEAEEARRDELKERVEWADRQPEAKKAKGR